MHRRIIAVSKISIEEQLKPLVEKYGTMPLDEVLLDLQRNSPTAKPKPAPVVLNDHPFKHGILSAPSDWIYTETDDPTEADFACAVSVKDGTNIKNMPMFVTFLKKHPDTLSDKEYREIEENCYDSYPEFKKVIDNEVYYSEIGKYMDNHGHVRTKNDFIIAPKVGIFLIDEKVKGTGLTCGCRIKYKDDSTVQHLKKLM